MRTFVGAIIENPAHGFLLQKRDYTPGIPFQGLWTLFGGCVKSGENPEQALFRELWEELRFERRNAVSYDVVSKNKFENGDVQIIYYVKTSASIQDLVLNEGASFGFFTCEEVFSRDFAFNIREVLESFFSTN
jgi:8-oxo-dGTP diphosphatase